MPYIFREVVENFQLHRMCLIPLKKNHMGNWSISHTVLKLLLLHTLYRTIRHDSNNIPV